MIETSSVPRAAASMPEERSFQTFKSLFTLADVAARRRAGRNIRKLTLHTDENVSNADETVEPSPIVTLRRSKSSGDIGILGEISSALNVVPGLDQPKKECATVKPWKGGRSRAVISSAPPSKIPKARAVTPKLVYFSESTDLHALESTPSVICNSETKTLNVIDDALFVMLTPPQTPLKKAAKNLTLAAHVPSLPKVASPFSPRNNISGFQRPQHPCSSRSTPTTGHTCASLHLTKSHWELRYDAWKRSFCTRRPHSVRSSIPGPFQGEGEVTRSRFPEPPTNPALFPRAGTLTPKALRQHSVASDDEARSTLELDWALRAWPMDKIQRTLYVHDMDVRVWFPVTPRHNPDRSLKTGEFQNNRLEPDLQKSAGRSDDSEREQERVLRRWEWDWELRWRVIEGMIEDEIDKDQAELHVENYRFDPYGGCEVKDTRRARRQEDDSEWSEDSMEIDALL